MHLPDNREKNTDSPKKIINMPNTKSPLMRALQKAFRNARMAQQQHEKNEKPPFADSRRRFIKTTASAAAITAVSGTSFLASCAKKNPPVIAIVGAGMAGLYAGYILRNAGYTAHIYEASDRTGGRIFTARNVMGVGTHTELGAEFIDSTHADILRLADDFNLSLLDTQTKEESALEPAKYFIGGKIISDTEILTLFQPYVARIEQDIEAFSDDFNYQHSTEHDQRLDRLSLAEYLQEIGINGVLYSLIDIAYTTEYGLDIAEQSCINFLMLINPQMDKRFKYSGYSDERFKIVGGNQSLTDSLADLLEGQIFTDKSLTAISRQSEGDKIHLRFASKGGGIQNVVADFAIITIPFTILRQVDIDYPLSSAKKQAIQELGYGQNAKFFMGFNKKVWREQMATGFMFSDTIVQNAWDHTQLQTGAGAGFTVFTGGAASKEMRNLDNAAFANQCMPVLNQVYPGIQETATGVYSRFYWPDYQFSKASYVCFKPGQYTTLEGAQSAQEGRLYFAGEHCSFEFQGFMNGAAETGRLAAEAILKAIK